MLITARSVALSFAIGFSTVAAFAAAQPPSASGKPAAPPPPRRPPGERLPARVPPDGMPSLTAAQREQLAALRRQTHEQLAPQREQLRAKRAELRALWLAEPPSEPAISKKMGEIDAIRAAMRPIEVKSRIARLALLTSEQRLALWRPKRPHECGCCAEGMRRMHPHEIARPRADGLSPWLDADDELWLDDNAADERDSVECGRDEPTPAKTPPERP
ncbi:MAG TPA: Spy/CpxP family protein refolding chaperone [Polyangiaceae bacterium]|nr:Spy/CpxP family protein refolding chaperone [Polyangiaceae bacterium]